MPNTEILIHQAYGNNPEDCFHCGLDFLPELYGSVVTVGHHVWDDADEGHEKLYLTNAMWVGL